MTSRPAARTGSPGSTRACAIVVSFAPGRAPELTVEGVAVKLRAMERRLVAAIGIRHPEPATVDVLIDALWPDRPPPTARRSLHNHLARLRRRAPGLLDSGRRGYVLADTVEVVATGWERAAGSGDDFPDLADVDGIDRRAREFADRRAAAPGEDATVRLTSSVSDEELARLEVDVVARPLDERRWWRLMVAHGVRGEASAVHGALARAEAALVEAGLDPGRRLLDVDRLVRDGVTDVRRLTADPFGRSGRSDATTSDLSPADLDAFRRLLSADAPCLVEVAGRAGARRSAVLARLVHEARVRGDDGHLLRLSPVDPASPETRRTPRSGRPRVIAVDGAEHGVDRALLMSRLAGTAPETTSFVLTSQVRTDTADRVDRVMRHVAATVEVAVDLRIDVSDDPDPNATGDPRADAAAALERAGPHASRVACVLALVGDAMSTSELARSVDDDVDPVAAVRAGGRLGLLRHDVRTDRVDVVNDTVGAVALDGLADAERRALADRLHELELDDESTLRRAARRARLVALADPTVGEPTVRATTEAIEAAHEAGQLDTASRIARLAMGGIEARRGRGLAWAHVALRAGISELAAGAVDPALTVLRDVVEVTRRLDERDLLSRAVLELCRLGPVAAVGRSDVHAERLVTALLDEESDPAARARIGAGAAMVFSFAGEPDRLRSIFDRGLADARAADDEELLCEILPLAYMSLPLPADLMRRRSIADELADVAERCDRADARWEALHLRLANDVMAGSGDVTGTFARLEEAADRLHERSRAWEMTYLRSNMALLAGDLDAARAAADATLTFAGDVNDERVAAVFAANHLAIALADGAVAHLVEPFRALVERQPDIRAWRAALAVSAAAAGDHDVAVAEFNAIDHIDDHPWIRDHSFVPALVCLGESAATIGDRGLVTRSIATLQPFAGTWSWCGSCTFGPVDLTLARLHLAAHDDLQTVRHATEAIRSGAALRAKRYVAAATDVLLAASSSGWSSGDAAGSPGAADRDSSTAGPR